MSYCNIDAFKGFQALNTYMSQETKTELDSKYTDGIWYDSMAGDFCQIREWGKTIGLFTPGVENFEEHGPYYTFDEEGYGKEDAIDKVRSEFRRVSDEAVENPSTVVERAINSLARNDPNEAIDLRYARQQVEIQEK